MNKILSIPLVILILFSGITVNFATHYCGSSVASTKVSLNREPANCGMESGPDIKSKEDHYINHCCDDLIEAYSLSSNYIPSFSFVSDFWQQLYFLTYFQVDTVVNNQIFVITADDTIRPPGNYTPNSVDRQVICLFRI